VGTFCVNCQKIPLTWKNFPPTPLAALVTNMRYAVWTAWRVEVQTWGARTEAARRVFDPRLGRDVHRGRALHDWSHNFLVSFLFFLLLLLRQQFSHFLNFLGFFPVWLLPRMWLPSAAGEYSECYPHSAHPFYSIQPPQLRSSERRRRKIQP